MLEPMDTLLRRYHFQKPNAHGHDFPSAAEFQDDNGELSVDLLGVWGTENALREHIGKLPRKYTDPDGPKKDPNNFGFAALSKSAVEAADLEVREDANPPSDPTNPAHHLIIQPDPPKAAARLWAIVMGYSPPPILGDVAGLLRCPRWTKMQHIMATSEP